MNESCISKPRKTNMDSTCVWKLCIQSVTEAAVSSRGSRSSSLERSHPYPHCSAAKYGTDSPYPYLFQEVMYLLLFITSASWGKHFVRRRPPNLKSVMGFNPYCLMYKSGHMQPKTTQDFHIEFTTGKTEKRFNLRPRLSSIQILTITSIGLAWLTSQRGHIR